MACKTYDCRFRSKCKVQSDKIIDIEDCTTFLKLEDAWWDEHCGDSDGPLPFTDPPEKTSQWIPPDGYVSDGDGWE